jgi:hypothetical protein
MSAADWGRHDTLDNSFGEQRFAPHHISIEERAVKPG